VILLAALAAAQVVAVPGAAGLSVDQRIAVLAEQEARGGNRIEDAIFDDPAMRAELRRVGFAKGCATVDAARKQVIGRHKAILQAEIDRTIRKVIPAERIAEARALSFLAAPFVYYQGRVERELEKSAAPALARARDDMRQTFLALSKPMPTTRNAGDNEVLPKPDVAAALGHRGAWNLDDPAQAAFACIEQRISPSARPTLTTGEPQR
jgi:hypothetical protein